DGPPPPPAPFTEDPPRDAKAAAEVQAGTIRLAAGTPLDLASAADCFTRALEREPDALLARYLRGVALEKPRTALADAQAAAASGRFAEALCLEARLLAALGQPGPALEAAEKALALAPDLAPAHAARAQALFRAGDLAASLSALDIALALDPFDDDVR